MSTSETGSDEADLNALRWNQNGYYGLAKGEKWLSIMSILDNSDNVIIETHCTLLKDSQGQDVAFRCSQP